MCEWQIANDHVRIFALLLFCSSFSLHSSSTFSFSHLIFSFFIFIPFLFFFARSLYLSLLHSDTGLLDPLFSSPRGPPLILRHWAISHRPGARASVYTLANDGWIRTGCSCRGSGQETARLGLCKTMRRRPRGPIEPSSRRVETGVDSVWSAVAARGFPSLGSLRARESSVRQF